MKASVELASDGSPNFTLTGETPEELALIAELKTWAGREQVIMCFLANEKPPQSVKFIVRDDP